MSRDSAGIRVRFLGTFSVHNDRGEVVGLPPAASALLAFISYHRGRAVPRDRLLEMFWRHVDPHRGRHCLASTLSRARRALTERGIPPNRIFAHEDRQCVSVRSEAVVWSDIDEIRSRKGRLDEGEEDGHALRQALNLYRGPLLEDQFADWIDVERRQFEAIRLRFLRELLRIQRSAGNFAESIAVAEEYLALDPLCEEVYRELISSYLARGETAKGVAVYERCKARMLEDLHVQPAPATRALLPHDAAERRPGRPATTDYDAIVTELHGILGRVQDLETRIRDAFGPR